MKRQFFIGLLAVMLAIGVCGGTGEKALAQSWTYTTPMDQAKISHTATLLEDGKVLVVGGSDLAGLNQGTAFIFDPADETWTPTGETVAAQEYGYRFAHAAARLPDGRVLVCGGDYGEDEAGRSAEIYDPNTDTWTAAASMNVSRSYFDLVALNNGRVLAVGGVTAAGECTDTAELYDPEKDEWTLTVNNMATARGLPRLTLLNDGKVLATGGVTDLSFNSTDSAEIYDPDNGTWSSATPMSESRVFHSAVRLQDGKVLVAGGLFFYMGNVSASPDAEIYDPGANTWSSVGEMTEARGGHAAAVLPDGRVLVAGGMSNNFDIIGSTEIYDPDTGWNPTTPLNQPRFEPTCTLLADGRGVLVTGGQVSGDLSTDTAEIYGRPSSHIQVSIDIKPEDCPNYLDVNSKGRLPVAICGAAGFDVREIDPASLRLSRDGITGEVAPVHHGYKDSTSPFTGEPCGCDIGLPDGFEDLTAHFDVKTLVNSLQLKKTRGDTVTLTLTGKLKEEYGGQSIRGQDCVAVLP